MINQRSTAGARQAGSNTRLFVSYVATRPLPVDRQTTTETEAGATATTKHAFHTTYTSPKSLLWENNHQTMRDRDECMPLVSSVNTVYYYDLHVTKLNNRNDFSPCFFVSKSYFPFFGTPSPCHKSDKKRVCNRASVCDLTRTYFTCTRTNYADGPELVYYHPRGRGRSHS